MSEVLSEQEIRPAGDQTIVPEGETETESGIELFDYLDDGNLVEMVENPTETAADIIKIYDEAKSSMEDWERKYKQALKLAKLEPDAKKKNFPFKNASNVMMPFILETMLDFHSRIVPELVWTPEIVRMATYGEDSQQKDERASRVSEFMNWQLNESIDKGTWRKRQDKMFLTLPCTGTSFKFTRFNYDDKEVSSRLLMADAVIFCHDYETFEEAPDYFLEEEYTRNEVVSFIRGAEQWDLDEDKLESTRDHPEPWEVLRAFTWIDLDDDGLDEPYEVVIWKEDDSIVSVRPAYDIEEINANDEGEIISVDMTPMFTQYQFLPDPEGGPMGMGWGILLGDMFKSMNTTVRQMIDAGTLANLAGNSGLIDQQLTGVQGRGNRQQSGPVEVRMGEMTPVSTGAKPLRDSVYQFPYTGPNQALFNLVEWMLNQMRGMTNAAYNMDTNSQEAAMMYLARLQQGLKVPNSIVMRVYNGAREEFNKIAVLNFRHHSDTRYNNVIDGSEQHSMEADFNPADMDIRAAIDPSQGSDIERQQRASIILTEAKEQQQPVLNLREAYLDFLNAMKVADVERIAPEPSGEPDPMEQLMIQNMAREAENEERELEIKERDLDLRTAKAELERAQTLMKGFKEAQEMGLEIDKTEAEIVEIYSKAFKNMWEMGMAGDDVVETTRRVEAKLIDKRTTAPPPPTPQAPPNPNPQATSQGA